MSSQICPTDYANKILSMLEPADGAVARTAIRIAAELLEYRIICECSDPSEVLQLSPLPSDGTSLQSLQGERENPLSV